MFKDEATAASRRVPIILRHSTTGVYTAGLTLTLTELQVSVNGGAYANSTGTFGEVGVGSYYYEAAAADVATRGYFQVKANKTDYEIWLWIEPVETVMPVVDSTGNVASDVKKWLATAASTPTVAGVPNVNAKTWNDLTTVALPLIPTTAGRALDVSAGGEAGIDWANVGSPTTTLGLSGTTVKTATDVETDTADIQTRIPAALVGGRIDASVGAMAADVMTAAAAAADLTTELQTGIATAASLATVAAYIDTEITDIQARLPAALTAGGKIKASTDEWLATAVSAPTVAGVPNVNAKTWNDLTTVALPLTSTTAGRPLDVTAGGNAGIDWANVEAPTTTLVLSGTTVKTATDVETDTADIQTRIPAALGANGNIKSDVRDWLATAASTPTVAGVPNVNAKTWNDLTTVALPLIPTTAGRALDVSAGGEAGIDWANVGSPTTTVGLSGTTVKTATDVETDTADIQTRIPAALGANGNIKSDVRDWLATAASTPTVAGVPNVNAKTWNDLTTVALPLIPTTAGRALDVSAGGEAGVDWANVGSPTTVLDLSGTTVKTATDVETDTANIQTRIPTLLVSGRIDASVGAMAADVMTAAAAAADLTTELQTGIATAANLATVAAYIDTEITTALADLDDIQTRLPAALVGGRMDTSVGAMAANVLTAAATAADFGTEIGTAILNAAHDGAKTVRGVLTRMDAFVKGKATGLIGTVAAFYAADGTTKVIEATQDVDLGTRTAASTQGGD